MRFKFISPEIEIPLKILTAQSDSIYEDYVIPSRTSKPIPIDP